VRVLIATGVPGQQEAGTAGVVFNHARELRKLGHEVDCWFLEDVLTRPARPKRIEGLIFACRAAQRILRERRRYEVVNLHAPWGCAYGAWRRALRPADAPPYVMTMQGSEERYVYAMRREHQKGRADHFGWQNRAWHRAYHQTMYRYSIQTADYAAIANREGWIFAQLKYGCNSDRVHFVPNGVEEMFFVPHSYEARSSLKLLYAGTWIDRKGVFYLVDAFERIARQFSYVTLTIAGCRDGAGQAKNAFTTEIRDRVNVIPFVKRAEMPALYASHDIFVFPSLVEGMPLTLLEAMAAGMPVVTTISSGMSDVVDNEKNGLIVWPADSAALAKAVDELCRSAELRSRFGQAAQHTMRGYTWECVTLKLEKILAQAAQQGPSQ